MAVNPMPHCIFLLLLACMASAVEAVPAPTGGPGWGAEPIEDGGRTRATIYLNGLWRFLPIRGEAQAQPADGTWGWIRVPGAWANRGVPLPGVAVAGGGAAWRGLDGNHASVAWNAVPRAWYEREIAIPAGWAGRQIVLELERVSTDALVQVDGREVGRVAWPGGTVDISAAVKPGTTALLRLLVEAAGDGKDVTEHTGAAADQVFSRKSNLATRGIIGDVLVSSRPAAGRITDVAIRTSTRLGRIDLDVGVLDANGPQQITARMLGRDGAVERSFVAEAVAVADGRCTVGWAWPDARLWDLGRPELYTLELAVRGTGIDDVLHERFGFREVWIAGRDLYLNGSLYHPRPAVMQTSFDKRICTVEGVDAVIAGFRAAGFDSQELWPWDVSERGVQSFHDLWQTRAAEQGWGIFASLISVRSVSDTWPAGEAAWTAAVDGQIRRWRNNPAILAWVHSPNMFGARSDQDPRVLGDRAALLAASDTARLAPGLAAQAIIKRLDPTRPVTAHQGGAVGDIQAVNFYPCLQQTQEVEEWLTRYLQEGDMPFWPVEFGPFYLDYRRGRIAGGWGRPQGTIYTELLATEYLAATYGRTAYTAETSYVRNLNPSHHQEGTRYTDIYKTWMTPLAETHQGQQIERIVRAWRAMGAPMLPVPWEFELGWDRRLAADGTSADVAVPCAQFAPGLRGCWKPSQPASERFWLQPRGSTRGPRGDAVARAYAPTLAFIAGAERAGDLAALTAKDHVYVIGSSLAKQAILINDSRAEQAWSLRWTVRVGGAVTGQGETLGRIATGTVQRVAITCALSAAGDGVVELDARIGETALSDRLPIHVLPVPAPVGLAVQVVDPTGDSSAVLRRIGCRLDGSELLVVGRNALSSGAITLEAVRSRAEAGGRVLVLAQDPQWMRSTLGWRVGHQTVRRVYAVDAAHPVLAGLAEDDLADWAGAGSLVEAQPRIEAPPKGYPRFGWRWGNRGSVSSAMIEKPHRSAWRPILEGDFDLAYTPLMELDLGSGRIVWCTLDLEARGAVEPAADRLVANLVRYAATAPLAGRRGCRVAGDTKAMQDLIGLAPVTAGGLLIAGAGTPRAQIDAQLAAGGSVLCLDASAAGLKTAERADAGGTPAVPDWTWCRGLSPSDLRLRAPLARRVIAGSPDGWQVAADGLLAQRQVGPGLLAVCLLDPASLPEAAKPYLRISRWRQVRALAQICANLGAGFAGDALDGKGCYLPGWSDDMTNGDDPHRYYRW
jgi:beta-galactosidase